MAFACAPFPAHHLRDRTEYACVGAPPEKEIAPEPRENGALLAAVARVLRDAFAAPRGRADKGPKPEPERR